MSLSQQQVIEILVRGRNESHKLFTDMTKDMKLSREEAIAFAAGWEKAAAQHEKAMQRIAAAQERAARQAAAEQKRAWDKTKADAEESARAVLKAGTMAAAGITAITVAIVALGRRGSEIINVERSLAALAGGSQKAAEIVERGRTASKGLINDFELTSAATKGLTLGLPITAQSMEILTKASVRLGQAMRREPTAALNDLLLGLSRGSPRILDNIGIIVRSEDAYRKWAAAHHTTTEAMTQGQKAIAVYEAAVVAAQQKFQQFGDIQVTFGERITQVRNGIQNFVDSLGKAIAVSPVMNRAAELAGQKLQKAFGTDQTKNIEKLVQHVNQFAIVLVQAGQVGVYAAEAINFAWIYAAISIRGALVAALLPFETLMKSVAVILESAALVNPVFISIAKTARSVSDQISLAFTSLKKDLKDSFQAGRDRDATLEKFREGLVDIEDELQKVAKNGPLAFKEIVAGANRAGDEVDGVTGKVSKLQLALKEAARDFEQVLFQQGRFGAGKAGLGLGHAPLFGVGKLPGEGTGIGTLTPEQVQAYIAVMTLVYEAQRKAGKEAAEAVTKDNEDAARATEQAWREASQNISDVFAEMADAIGGSFGAIVDRIGRMFDLLVRHSERFRNFLASSRGQALSGYAQAGMAGFDVGQMTGSRIGSPGRGALGGLATGAATGAIMGSILPGIGTAGGAVVGGALGAFGGWLGGRKAQAENRKAMEEMRAALLQQFGSMAALQKKADELGVSIAGAFSTKDPQRFQQIVDNLNAAMAEQQKRREGIATAFEGLQRMVEGFALEMDRAGRAAGMAWDEAQKKLEKYKKELEAAGKTEQEIRELMRQRERQLTGGIQEATEEQRAAFRRLGDYAAATFGAMVRESGNVISALRQMADTLNTLTELQERFGFEGSAAFNELLKMHTVLKENEDLALQIEGLTMMIQGLGAAGFQTAALFQGFGLDIVRIFEELTARTGDSTMAMVLMQPSLQALWEHQQRFGTITDEATLALLEQAETQGLVGENMKSVYERILGVLEAIARVLGALPTERTVTINVRKNDPDNVLGEGGGSGGGGEDSATPHRSRRGEAWGGRVPWTPGGTPALIGERETENILSDDQLRDVIGRAGAMNGGSFQGGGPPIVLESHFTIVLDGAQVGRAMERRVVAGHHPGLGRGR